MDEKKTRRRNNRKFVYFPHVCYRVFISFPPLPHCCSLTEAKGIQKKIIEKFIAYFFLIWIGAAVLLLL